MNKLKERVIDLSPEQRALLDLMMRRKGLTAIEIDAIPRRTQTGPIPLSFSQQRLWFLHQLSPGTPIYNEPLIAVRLKGSLNIAALQWALDEVVRRHESLRTTFPSIDGQPVQLIVPPQPVALQVTDLRHYQEREREEELKRLALAESQYLFDLARGQLFRASLIRMGEYEYVVFLELHHIITDGWSNRLLMREISELYRAFCTNSASPLPELPIQYGDFTIWQRERLQGERLNELLAIWLKRLASSPPELRLPTDFPRPSVQTFQGATQFRRLSKELNQALKALSNRHGVTLFMTLLAAFTTLLYRYSGQNDLVIGSPVANRNRRETERLIGFFVNTLVLRIDLSGNPKFTDLMKCVREVATEAYANQDLPFEKLVEALQPERSLNRQSLFQALFGLHNYPTDSLDIHGMDVQQGATVVSRLEPQSDDLSMEDMQVESAISKFDLALSMSDLEEQGLKAQLDYSTDLFTAATIGRMLTHFETLLHDVVAHPETRVNALRVFSEAPFAHLSPRQKEEEELFLKRLQGRRGSPTNLDQG